MKKVKIVFLVLGFLCFLLAAAIPFRNRLAEEKREEAMRDILERFESVLPERTQSSVRLVEKNETPAISIGGQEVDFLLELPMISLPVGKLQEKDTVKAVPCILEGSVGSCDLLIMGSCTENVFQAVSATDLRDPVSVTDVYGRRFSYRVEKVIHTENPDSIEAGRADLVLLMKKNTDHEYLVYDCTAE